MFHGSQKQEPHLDPESTDGPKQGDSAPHATAEGHPVRGAAVPETLPRLPRSQTYVELHDGPRHKHHRGGAAVQN